MKCVLSVKFSFVNIYVIRAGGVRTGVALHSGSDIFNMAAEVS